MIKVNSEFGKLKKVLLHRPGEETENLVPSTFSRLLFDDFYYLKEAQKEHDAFAAVFKRNGTEVVYLEDLVAETLKESTEDIRQQFIRQFIIEAGIPTSSSLFERVFKYLDNIDNNKKMVLKMMSGIKFDEIKHIKSDRQSLSELVFESYFVVEPMPNLIFTRDPFSTIGHGISLHTMNRPTRKRETIFAEFVFNNHKDYINVPRYYDRYQENSLEGGDVMILSDKEIAVGISERSEPDAIEKLAYNIFKDPNSTIEKVYAINIPKGRAWMHLDTVFTQIDKDKFAIFTNHEFTIFVISKHNASYKVEKAHMSIDELMKKVFGMKKVHLIKCGNGDPFIAEREQWNDGSNVLAIAPNEVIVYDRNYVTNKALKDAGVKVHEIPGAELGRGRGGPRCMSMPLVREDVFNKKAKKK